MSGNGIEIARLRKVAERTISVMNQYKENHLVPAYFSVAIAELRDTLADPYGEKSKKTVQCADCLEWIDRDASHTCKQQIRRNKTFGHKERK